ncbi:ABC transporter permease subunit [Nonomuraea sp. NPDC049695]|uniref:ABC transporter permease subunit n=1 Tax=Nonomuraea sp. NPDC049695 TaxID=3154734 RepID=UPI0034273A88
MLNVFGLILANTAGGIPFAVLLIRAFMGSIPRALVEAALVDGAGNLRAFVSIIVPISKNAIVTAALFTFLGAWSDFLLAITLTSTPGSPAHHARHLRLHQREHPGLERGDGHRGARLHPGGSAADIRPALHRGRRHQRRDQMRKERT